MKKNLTKLALSGAALAAVAATLGTSTYAWYTTNPTVNANNIVGASSDSGASSIFISKDNTNWSQTVKFDGTEFTADKLVPVQSTTTAGSFVDMKNGAAGDTDYVTVTLYFKTSKTSANVPLYVKSITLTNSTATLPATDNLLAGDDTTITTGNYGVAYTYGTYTVDFTRALAMEITDATSTEAIKQTIDLGSYNTSYKTGTNTVTTGKAHAYYNKVMGADNQLSAEAISAGQAKTAALAKTALASLDKDCAVTTLKFYIFLNGWNDFCYDACQGQQFTLNMSFTSDATAAIGTTA
jgi:hypothetical protein